MIFAIFLKTAIPIVAIPLKIFKNDNLEIQIKILKFLGIQPRHKSAIESEQTFIETLFCEHYRRSVFGCMYWFLMSADIHDSSPKTLM